MVGLPTSIVLCLLVLFPSSLSVDTVYSCTFDTHFTLTVNLNSSTPSSFTYTVYSTQYGDYVPWLENGSLSLVQNQSFLVPANGLLLNSNSPIIQDNGIDIDLGTFTYYSIPWITNPEFGESVEFITNFTCFTDFQLLSFTIFFPNGIRNIQTVPPQSEGSNGLDGGNSIPSIHFPSFSATPGTTNLRSSSIGYIEWNGEMDTYNNNHGVGLANYKGGQQSGPLLLFNSSANIPHQSKPQALTIGPGNGYGTNIAHQIFGVVPDSQEIARQRANKKGKTCNGNTQNHHHKHESMEHSLSVMPNCFFSPHTDEIGANNAPGTYGGIVVQPNNETACCEACMQLGDLCDSWVYDTDGYAGGSNCWPLLGIQGSKQVSDRSLGLNWQVECNQIQANTVVTEFTSTIGFEGGLFTGSIDNCCLLCSTLGPLACQGFLYNFSVTGNNSDCFPLLNYTGTVPTAANVSFSVISPRPLVLAAGVQGYIMELPPQFKSVYFLSGSSNGIIDSMYHYGEALRLKAHLQRMPKSQDPLRNLVTYWSDNGAYYFDGYWPLFFNETINTAEQIFINLKNYWNSLNLTVGSVQMDPWWYGGACGASGPPPAACYHQESWPWMANFSTPPPFFPNGLASLGLPLTLYSNLYIFPEYNEMNQFTWINSTACTNQNYTQCGQGTPGWSHVLSSQSYDFHSYLFDTGISYGMNAFEIDFADWMFLGFGNDFSINVRSYDEYQSGMNQAALEHNFPVQLCMTLPSITLDSVHWNSVTNARLQGDGYATNGGRYDIFQSSLLYGAVELAPFLDNIWTTSCQPALDNPFGNSTCEDDVEGLAIIATLSTGPVGFADRVNFTNVTLLQMTMRKDSVLLQPALPATNIELWYNSNLYPFDKDTIARITTAPSFIPAGNNTLSTDIYLYPFPYPHNTRNYTFQTSVNDDTVNNMPYYLFLTVFTKYLDNNLTLTPIDLWPILPLSNSMTVSGTNITGYYITTLSNYVNCKDGSPIENNNCGYSFFSNSSNTPIINAVSNTDSSHELYSISPIFTAPSSSSYSQGWSILGELNKFTRVSLQRIHYIEPDCLSDTINNAPNVCIHIIGMVNESVDFTVVDPNNILHRSILELDNNGEILLTCTCNGNCSCY